MTFKLNFFRKQVEVTKVEAARDNVIVPLTLEEYCIKSVPKNSEELNDVIDLDEDYYDCGDETGNILYWWKILIKI